jgi:uncharacterized membrane protein (DUF106 family)
MWVMLGENLVLTLLEACVTGAGLVIAIYALIAPISSKIFERRLETLKKRLKQFEDVKAQTTPEKASKDAKTLKTLGDEIKEMKTFPSYLGPLVFMDFALFAITAINSSLWFVGRREETQVYPILGFFIASMTLFVVVGTGAIIDVYSSMKREFEQLKKEKEEVEETTKEQLERLKKDVETLKRKGVNLP